MWQQDTDPLLRLRKVLFVTYLDKQLINRNGRVMVKEFCQIWVLPDLQQASFPAPSPVMAVWAADGDRTQDNTVLCHVIHRELPVMGTCRLPPLGLGNSWAQGGCELKINLNVSRKGQCKWLRPRENSLTKD